MLTNIGDHFLNELITEENLHKEIDELIKLSKVADGVTDENADKRPFKLSSQSDIDSLLQALNKGFENAAKDMFKVSQDESFSDREFQDIKNLRIAKLLIKLRLCLLNMQKLINKKLPGEEDKKIYQDKNLKQQDASFFTSIFDNLKTSQTQEIPLFD